MFNTVASYRYLLPNLYLSVADIANPDLFASGSRLCRLEHVCQGTTTQEPRPRPMKKTLHSIHHSTVLHRLGVSRKESPQNLHTHAVDTAIQHLGNNRVLKDRPPPIVAEEQRLHRRQRCTPSQLRSGHFHLLQEYKHRVFVEPSDICTDCGASPQDVRHPTELSPEDLWPILDPSADNGGQTTITTTSNTNLVIPLSNQKLPYRPNYTLQQYERGSG